MSTYHESDDATRAAMRAVLHESHAMRTTVRLYGTDAKSAPGVLLDGIVTEGQVDVTLDNEGSATHTLGLTLMDPRGRFHFDPMGNVYADDFIGVRYGVYVPDLDDWVDTDVFFGPVSRFERNGDVLTLEAVGKEAMLQAPAKMPAIDFNPADRYARTVVKEIAEAYGESRFRLTLLRGKKVPSGFSIDPTKIREQGAWWFMQQIAAKANCRLVYAGDGFLEARRLNPKQPAYTFRDSLSEPVLSYDLSEVRNRVEVWDQDSKGKPDPIVRVDLPASHPLSKESLARGGKDRILVERIELPVVKLTVQEGLEIADGYLKRMSNGALDVQFEHLPVPFLVPGDKAEHVGTNGQTSTFTVKRFTLPLTAEDSMSVGYNRPVRVSRKKKYTRRVTVLKKRG